MKMHFSKLPSRVVKKLHEYYTKNHYVTAIRRKGIEMDDKGLNLLEVEITLSSNSNHIASVLHGLARVFSEENDRGYYGVYRKSNGQLVCALSEKDLDNEMIRGLKFPVRYEPISEEEYRRLNGLERKI